MKEKHTKPLKLIGFGALASSIFWVGVLLVYAVSPSTIYLFAGIYPAASSHTVWKEGDSYFSKDAYGKIDYSGTNATQILYSVVSLGGKIYVKDATYTLSAPLLIRRSNVELLAESRATILKLTTPPSSMSVIDVGVSPNQYSNIRIKGFKIDGSGTLGYGILFRYYILDSFIEDNEIIDTNLGIDLDNACHRNTISGNYIHSSNSESLGIEIYRSNDNDVSGNFVTQIGGAVGGRGINLEEARGNIITQNVVSYMQRGSAFGDGISLLTNAVGNTVSYNTVKFNEYNGINFEGGSGNALGNSIIGNTVYNNSLHGIFIGTSTDNQVIGGIIEANGEKGISVYDRSDRTLVSGVTLLLNKKGAIYIYRSQYCRFNSLTMKNNVEQADLTYKTIQTETSASPYSSYNDFSDITVIEENGSKRPTYVYADESANNDYNCIGNSRFSYLAGTTLMNLLGAHSEVYDYWDGATWTP